MKAESHLRADERLQSGVIKMVQFLDERLVVARIKNDAVILDADRAVLLGDIAAMKRLRKFIETKPAVVPDSSAFED